jgi:SAM-dependent methyltransferase
MSGYSYLQWRDSAFQPGEIQQEGLAQEMRDLLGRDSVLDVGCGNGRFCTVCDPSGYLGIDISPISVATATRIHPEYSFEVMDAVTDLPGRTFDTVLTWTVLEHIPHGEISGLLSRLAAVCRRMVVVEPLPDGAEWAAHCFPHEYGTMIDITSKRRITGSVWLLEAKGGLWER